MGGRRRIGDGESTKVWKVPWLPCEENKYISTNVVPELQDVVVRNLIDTNAGTWDYDLIHELFNERDCQLIKRIPIPIQRRCDSWF